MLIRAIKQLKNAGADVVDDLPYNHSAWNAWRSGEGQELTTVSCLSLPDASSLLAHTRLPSTIASI